MSICLEGGPARKASSHARVIAGPMSGFLASSSGVSPQSGVPVMEGPVLRADAAGPILSVDSRDPDGHLAEVSNPTESPQAEDILR
jgi:hypothetical protein